MSQEEARGTGTDENTEPGGAETDGQPSDAAPAPKEIGGRKGPDPTRYGDWEKNGRCIDF